MKVEFRLEIEKYVEDRVRSGEFPSAAAVLEEAVARMMSAAQVTLTPEDDEAIAAAEAEYERGEHEDFDTVAARLRARIRGR